MKTLRNSILLFYLIVTVNTVFAGDFKGGLLAGFCASQMDGDRLAGYHKFGPTAGFFINRDIDENWAGQFEIRFDQKGAAYVNGEQSYKARMNYVELPFMVNYKIYNKFKAEIGLEPSVLIRSTVLFNQFKTNPKYNSFDLPIAIGGYYTISKSLEINIRFSYSLLPVKGNSLSKNIAFYGYNTFNNAFNFVLYYYLR